MDTASSVEGFRFVSEHQAMYPIATMCRVLGVSPTGFHAWQRRGPSRRALRDRELLERIRSSYECSGRTYGLPRIHADLVDEGIQVGRKRVARLMRAAGLVGASRRERVLRTTQRD